MNDHRSGASARPPHSAEALYARGPRDSDAPERDGELAASPGPLLIGRERDSLRSFVALGIALLVHGALAASAVGLRPSAMPAASVTEIELAPPREAPPKLDPPAPESPPAATPAATLRRPTAVRAPARVAAPPVLTAREDVAPVDEPVRFVTDENGTAFGSGLVAQGASAGVASAAGAPEPGGPPAAPPSLSRAPRLSVADPCRGFFPKRARVDRGEVTLKVRVEPDGSALWMAIVSERPAGEGFSFAARDCLRAQRFTPALDRAGRATAVVSPITVRFSR